MSGAARAAARAAALLAGAGALEAGFEWLLPYGAWRQLALTAGVNVLVALSLTIVNGWAGQFNLGHAGFLAVGAYGSALVAANVHLAWPGGVTWARSLVVVPAAVGSGAAAAALGGLLVGLPSLRLRGDYLAVVTLAFAEVVRLLVATASADGGAGPVGRALAALGGPGGYAGPDDQGVPLYAGPFWVALAVGGGLWAAWRLKHSPWGRALRATRDDELAASACGVDATRYKVTSFVLAAGGAGVAGGLLALLRDGSPLVQPAQFTLQASFDAVVMVMAGGAGSISGAVAGALFVTFAGRVFEALQGAPAVVALQAAHPALDLNALRAAAYALLLLALVRARPGGAFGEREAFGGGGRGRGAGAPPGRGAPAPGAGGGLAVDEVSKTFGGVRALARVSLRVPPGAIFGLIGPNGAGKSTLLNLVSGFGAPDPGGRVAVDGAPVAGRGPAHVARAGVARTFQNVRLFDRLTALDNVLVGAEARAPARLGDALVRPRAARRAEAERRARALELLDLFGLGPAAERSPGELSYGDRRRLELARALMASPRLLLLDEPAAGLNHGEAAELAGRVRALRDRFGLTVVLVEHNVALVLGLCDVVHVLDHGVTIAEGPPADVRAHPAVVSAYLGRAHDAPARAEGPPPPDANAAPAPAGAAPAPPPPAPLPPPAEPASPRDAAEPAPPPDADARRPPDA